MTKLTDIGLKSCKCCGLTWPIEFFTVNYTRTDRFNRLKTYYKPDCKPCTANLARYRRSHGAKQEAQGV